jgi:hypothetical protein
MSDFCLGARAVTCIARQADLMDRMSAHAGIATGTARNNDPGLWYEARLRCLGCPVGQHCARFLASRASGQPDVPDFCANRAFFTEQCRSLMPGRLQ